MVSPRKLLKQLESFQRMRSLTKSLQLVALSQLAHKKKKISSRNFALIPLFPYFVDILYSEYPSKKYLIVPITIDKSCCGSHNSTIIKYSKNSVDYYQQKNKTVKIVSIGKKAKFFFKKFYRSLQFMNIYGIDQYPLSLFVSNTLLEYFCDFPYDKLHLIFNRFYSAFDQQLSLYELNSYSLFHTFMYDCYLYENKYGALCTDFVNSSSMVSSAFGSFFGDFYEYAASLIILDSLEENEYSALGARVTTMNNANDNLSEIVESLTIRYHKARQESITTEIIEVVSCVDLIMEK